MSRINKMQSVVGNKINDWQRFTDIWESEQKGSRDGLANYNMPVAFSIIMNKHAEEIQTQPQVKIEAVEAGDMGKEEFVHEAWDSAWNVDNTDETLAEAYIERDILGTVVVKETYEVRVRTVKERVVGQGGDDEKSVYQDKVIVDYDDVKSRVVSLENFAWDETAKDIDDARDCVEWFDMSLDNIMQEFSSKKIYKNLDKILAGVHEINKIDNKEDRDVGDDKKDMVTIYEYWNKMEDRYIVIANNVVIRDTPIPYDHKELPYAIAYAYKKKKSKYGRGVIELCEPFIDLRNSLRNMGTDGVKRRTEPTIFIDESVVFLDDDEYWGGPKRVQNAGGIKEFVIPDTSKAVYDLNAQNDEDIITTTGIDFKSVLSAPSETATKTAVKKENQLKMVSQGIKMLERTFFRRWFNLRLSNLQQFYSQERLDFILNENPKNKTGIEQVNAYKTIRVKGKKIDYKKNKLTIKKTARDTLFTMNPEVIRGQFDIRVVSASSLFVSQELKRAKSLESLEVLAKIIPLLQAQGAEVPDLTEIIKELVVSLGWDVNKILPKLTGAADKSPEDIFKERGIPIPGQEEPQPVPVPGLPQTTGGDPALKTAAMPEQAMQGVGQAMGGAF